MESEINRYQVRELVKSGIKVVYLDRFNAVITVFDHKFGRTQVVYDAGYYQVWHTKASSIWDTKRKIRIIVPAVYRVVKKLPPINGIHRGIPTRFKRAYIMRVMLTDTNEWRDVRDELIAQVTILRKQYKMLERVK